MSLQNPDYSNINLEDLASKIGLKVKHMPILISSFIEESESIMNELQQSIEAKDFPNIKQKAHAIKGSSGNLRFDEIYEMAKEMELSAQAEKEIEYQKYFDAIKSAISTIPN